MTLQQFEELVRSIEKRFSGKPLALRNRVLLWAVLGYFSFFCWFGAITLVAACFLVPGIMLGNALLVVIGTIILLIGSWSVGRTLYISVAPPTGRKVKRPEAPALFQCLDELRARCRSPQFDAVYVTTSFNASVMEQPRLGVFGWWKKHLMIGLPLLDLLTAEELRAVLAHEFAHLSRQHARFGHWIYRLRRAWDNLFSTYLNKPVYEGEVSGRVLLRKFLNWYWPRFNARALLFSRSCEYMADSLSAQMTGAQTLALALARIQVYGEIVDKKFWPDLWLLARKSEGVPDDVFHRVSPYVSTYSRRTLQTLLPAAMQAVTTNADTHPCLSERISALNLPEVPRLLADGLNRGALNATATKTFLGSAEKAIRNDLNVFWKKNVSRQWKQSYARGVSLEHRLKSINTVVSSGVITDAEVVWDKARTLIELHGDAAAEPLLREVLSVNPAHALANFHLGRHLIDERKEEGVDFLERAIAQDEGCLQSACQLMFNFYRETGNNDRLQAIRQRIDQHQVRLAASVRERQNVTAADSFVPHELSGDELAAVRIVIQKYPEISRAWLARKKLENFQKQRLFLLTFETRRPWYWLRSEQSAESLISKISSEINLPGRVLIFTTFGPFSSVAKKARLVPSASIK